MNQITLLSYGAGQDSHTILTKIVEDPAFRAKHVQGELIVVMADTENEHAHTYEHIERVRGYCCDNDIEFVLTGEEYRTASWKGGLVHHWSTGNRIGSKAYPKTCTDNLKVQPIYKYVADSLEMKGFGTSYRKKSLYTYAEQYGKLRVLIGIAKGEEKRVKKANAPKKWQQECLEIAYPLIEEGLDRAACQEYLNSMESVTGIPCPMPSNCMFCPFNELFDLVWLSRNEPARLGEWIRLEQAKLDNHIASDKPNLGVWGRRT